MPKAILLALWGVESDYGTSTGSVPVVRALASLAFSQHRGTVFRDELIAALRILEEEGMAPAALRGSWAGAMGQVQFMPSTYLGHAVDGDGDGKRDIWNSVPDALASMASFLRHSGWQPALPWGCEVVLPQGLDLHRHRRSFAAWAAAGLRRGEGQPLPSAGEAELYLPAGIAGPAFLITDNFEALRAYNTSDAYALAVGHLADRLGGGGPIHGSWPAAEGLDRAGRKEVQKRLLGLGLYEGAIDGRLGPRTRAAVRRFQIERGLVADGYPDAKLLEALRTAR